MIEDMKTSDNKAISRRGKVLEGAKFGFALGYSVPIAVIAAGQLIMGNPLTAVWIAGQMALTANPVAMTCAPIGAICYGWQALSEQEKNEIIKRLCEGLDMGAELIKAVIAFVVAKTKDLLSSENMKEIRVSH